MRHGPEGQTQMLCSCVHPSHLEQLFSIFRVCQSLLEGFLDTETVSQPWLLIEQAQVVLQAHMSVLVWKFLCESNVPAVETTSEIC